MNRTEYLSKALLALIAVSGCGEGFRPDTTPDDEEELGVDEAKIVGGEDTTIAQHPFQIALMDSSLRQFCGGSILSDTFVLTAQHCVDTASPADLRVGAGSSKRSTMENGQVRSVSQIIRFPGFTDPDRGKDVALLKLTVPLDLSGNSAKAIPIVAASDAKAGATDPGVDSIVTGWGTLESGGDQPDILQAVTVQVIDQDTLKKQYGANVTDDQIGAAAPGKDSCQGDSGGPLTVGTGANRKLAGVVSYGQGCAEPNFAGVYARVSSFESWIKEKLGNTQPDPGAILTVPDVTVARRKWKRYTVTIPEGTASMTIVTRGGDGDGDLYVKRTSNPTTSSYDCRSNSASNMETCTFANPPAGTWNIGIYGYTAVSGMELRATLP